VACNLFQSASPRPPLRPLWNCRPSRSAWRRPRQGSGVGAAQPTSLGEGGQRAPHLQPLRRRRRDSAEVGVTSPPLACGRCGPSAKGGMARRRRARAHPPGIGSPYTAAGTPCNRAFT